jgi:hypothetical protein
VRALSAPRPFVRRGARKVAILRFRLPRAGLVVFEVRQLSPECRRAGLLRVNGRAGVNRVRFSGRVGGRMLAPGTYELRARFRPSVRVRIAILPRHARATTVATRLRTSTCAAAPAGTASSSGSAVVATAASAAPPSSPSSGDAGTGDEDGASGVAGAESDGDREATPPAGTDHPGRGLLPALPTPDGALGALLLALLLTGIGASMLLLGAAALPDAVGRRERLSTVVADRRLELAVAGTATLLVVTIAYLLAIA